MNSSPRGVDSRKLPASRGDFEKEQVKVASGHSVDHSSKGRFKEGRPAGTVKSVMSEVSGLHLSLPCCAETARAYKSFYALERFRSICAVLLCFLLSLLLGLLLYLFWSSPRGKHW